MILLLLLAFNAFILFFALNMGVQIFHPVLTNFQFYSLAVIAVAVVCGLAFLFNSPVGQWVLRVMSGARKTIPREDEKLKPIIDHVQQGIRESMHLTSLPVTLLIVDEPMPNAAAIGKHTLIVSRALYEMATDEELAGVIAHEFGHLHNGDSNKLGIALGVSVVSLTISVVCGFIAAFFNGIGNAFSRDKEVGWMIGLFTLVFSLFAWFFLLFVKGGNWMLNLMMLFMGRKQEYQADQFAIKAGFGAGLLSFLDKTKNMQFDTPKNLFERLYATHPPTMLRIGEVEKAIQ